MKARWMLLLAAPLCCWNGHAFVLPSGPMRSSTFTQGEPRASCRAQSIGPHTWSRSSSRCWAAPEAPAVSSKPVVEEAAGKRAKHVVMEDVQGRTINVTMQAFLSYEGKKYCVGVPVDTPMVVINGRGVPLESTDEATERMFWQLDDYFANKGYDIQHTAGFLTIPGEPDWLDDVDYDSEAETDDEGEDEEMGAQEKTDDGEQDRHFEEGAIRVDPIADVEFEGSVYKICQLLDKIPLSAEYVEGGEGQEVEGRWKLVTDRAVHVLLDQAAKQR